MHSASMIGVIRLFLGVGVPVEGQIVSMNHQDRRANKK